MRGSRRALMVAVTAGALASAVPFAALAQPPLPPAGISPCAGPHRLRVLDLDMMPDPLPQGQLVQRWVLTVQSDYNGECATVFTIRDRDQIVGRGAQSRIAPGVSKVTVTPVPNYRFQSQDHCFLVFANIANNQARVDTAKQVCARLKPVQTQAWTLK